MLSYEMLAKLKAANFPRMEYFTAKNQSELDHVCGIYEPDCGGHGPTLEELIDACGKEFMLTNQGGGWEALAVCIYKSVGMEEGSAKHHVEGATPIEAVANLYLQLNPKKDETR